MIHAEVSPGCDPLSLENKLVFAIGLFTGTRLVNTSGVSIGAKSPLTGTIKESNAGGTVAAALGKLGIRAVALESQASRGELYVLRIGDTGSAALVPARQYEDLRTYALVKELLREYGEKNGVLCIGPAGEHQMAAASIQSSDVDGRPCRAADRGGLGALMGSNGLKALVADQGGKSADPLADPQTFKDAARAFAQAVKTHPFSVQMLPALGTAGVVAPINAIGAFPSYNATKGFTREDDRLPRFFYEESLPPHNAVFQISDEKINSTLAF